MIEAESADVCTAAMLLPIVKKTSATEENSRLTRCLQGFDDDSAYAGSSYEFRDITLHEKYGNVLLTMHFVGRVV